jgi:hypothetical protein
MGTLNQSALHTPACPAYLESFTWTDGTLTLECFVDYSPADPTVGLTASAWLCHAYLGAVDLSEYLADGIVQQIEEGACLRFSGS